MQCGRIYTPAVGFAWNDTLAASRVTGTDARAQELLPGGRDQRAPASGACGVADSIRSPAPVQIEPETAGSGAGSGRPEAG
jgi:hypothetical protein